MVPSENNFSPQIFIRRGSQNSSRRRHLTFKFNLKEIIVKTESSLWMENFSNEAKSENDWV